MEKSFLHFSFRATLLCFSSLSDVIHPKEEGQARLWQEFHLRLTITGVDVLVYFGIDLGIQYLLTLAKYWRKISFGLTENWKYRRKSFFLKTAKIRTPLPQQNFRQTKSWMFAVIILVQYLYFFFNFFKSLLTVIFQEYQRYQKDLSEVSVQIFRPKFHIFILYRKYFLSRTSKILLAKVLLRQRSSNFDSFLEKKTFFRYFQFLVFHKKFLS